MISLLSGTLSICKAAASETIYIRADGSIDPPTANITTPDDVIYTFTDNNHDQIVVERDNIILDGSGYVLQGTGNGTESGTGIYLSGRVNVTIQNVRIDAFDHGVDLRDSFNNTVSGNNITANWLYGVYLDDSSSNNISGNSMTDNYIGIQLNYSPGNTVSGNNVSNRYCGILLYHSSNNTVLDNVFVGDGLRFVGSSHGNVVENNIVNGKPLAYLEGASNQTVSEAGQVILVNSEHIRVENLNLSHTICGVELLNTHNTLISGNKIANNSDGLRLHSSSNNTVSNNSVANNLWCGLWLDYSLDNNISDNSITNNYDGILLTYSSGNMLSDNTIAADNYDGIYLHDSSSNTISGNNVANNTFGIYLHNSPSNTVADNNITSSEYDGLRLSYSSGNIVSGNNIANNRDGITLEVSSGSNIYHNNFLSNVMQETHYGPGINAWDDGYPSGGNYWSDYTGPDAKSGPGQDQLGSDGMGDTPYVHNSDNRDRYPLMKPYPWNSPDLGVTHIDVSKAVVGQGYTLHVNVTMFNYGSNAEHVNVTVFANATTIHTSDNILLAGRNTTTITFSWNTSDFVKGNHVLEFVISTVPDETDTSDNTLVDGWVFITIPGDVDGDRDVDIFDIVHVAGPYGVEDLPWGNPLRIGDIDDDGDIDIFDLVIAAGNYGDRW